MKEKLKTLWKLHRSSMMAYVYYIMMSLSVILTAALMQELFSLPLSTSEYDISCVLVENLPEEKKEDEETCTLWPDSTTV